MATDEQKDTSAIFSGESAPPVKPLADRIRDGGGGMFQAWERAENFQSGSGTSPIHLGDVESSEKTKARHNLVFTDFADAGLQTPSSQPFKGLATEFTPESVKQAAEKRSKLLKENPNAVILAEVRYRDARDGDLPEDSPLWKRDEKGNRVEGNVADGKPRHLLDYSNPELQDLIAKQAQAVVKSGAVDGVMLDWWGDGENADRVNLVRKVREAIGEDAVIIVNSNGMKPEKSAPYINGMYMEGLNADFFNDPDKAGQTLLWAQKNLDKNLPPITALEGWGDRNDQRSMREGETLSLTHYKRIFSLWR